MSGPDKSKKTKKETAEPLSNARREIARENLHNIVWIFIKFLILLCVYLLLNQIKKKQNERKPQQKKKWKISNEYIVKILSWILQILTLLKEVFYKIIIIKNNNNSNTCLSY